MAIAAIATSGPTRLQRFLGLLIHVGLAVCVPAPGARLDAEGLLGWLEGRVARYKRPHHVVFWDEMPKSAYGKITKKMIREELVRRGEMPDP